MPYLVVHYAIEPLDGGGKAGSAEPIRGTMMPMVARDGLHYGASIEMPKAGHYKLDLCDRAAFGRRTGPPRRPGHGRRTLVEAVRGLV